MLTILGGGGWFPAFGRHTACALLRNGDTAIMIDAGTGVGRLIERPELLAGVQRLDIVLTHFHLDHMAGLAYLPAIGACAQTTIWGPGRLLYGIPTRRLLDQLSHEPFHPVPLEMQHIAVRDLTSGELELGGVAIATRRQDRHSAPSLGSRFGDSLAWITDTAHDPCSSAFAAGCKLLAHEAWFTMARPRTPEIHSSAAEAVRVALEAESEELLLIHLPPFERSTEALLDEAREQLPSARIASELAAFPLLSSVGNH
jgi:ribonuclease BN (tRNA processing enzyme)